MRVKSLNLLLGWCAVLVCLNMPTYVLAQDTNDVTIPVEDVNNFAKVYSITKEYYVDSVSDKKLMGGSIDGMLTNLDPHSAYLDAKDFKELNELTTGSFAGIGVEVSRDKSDDAIKVIAPIDGTPAYKEGIKSGDLIIKIDDKQVSDLTLDQAIQAMRGKPGTKVHLLISRSDELQPLAFTVTRAKIEVKSVKYAMLPNHYAYVRITDFQGDTASNLVATLKHIYQLDPHVRGLLLDLRDDPGGILQAAVGSVGAFIPTGKLVVYTDGRAPHSKQKFYVVPEDYNIADTTAVDLNQVPAVFKSMPIVVLVNRGTASAAEIMSGALQDYKRVKIVGTTTFGKGSVQTVIPLSSDTAIKLTTALYYTPNGRSIQAKGIKPDVIVKSKYDDLYDSWDVSEATLDHHLNNPNPNIVQVTKDKDNTPVIAPPKQIKTKAELIADIKRTRERMAKVVHQDQADIDLVNDFQLQWAFNILQGRPLPHCWYKCHE